jgi:uncharacterized protein
METLPPNGYFDPTAWIYEQICLALPQRQICDASCPGIEVADTDSTNPAGMRVDHRWAALAQLQQQLEQETLPDDRG